jgi:hypothetical protein
LFSSQLHKHIDILKKNTYSPTTPTPPPPPPYPLSETQTPESPLTTSHIGGLATADYSPNQDYSPSSNNDNPSNSSPKAPRSEKTSNSPNRSIKVQAMGELGTEEIVKNPTEKIGEIDCYINGLLEKLKVERQKISEMEAARTSIKNMAAQKEQENVEPVVEKKESVVEVTTKSSSSTSPTNNSRNERVGIREAAGRPAVDKAKKISITSLEPFKGSKLSLNEIISISTQRMNFGVGMPGKIVEESLDITNKTNEDIVVQIFVDCLNAEFKESEEYIYSIRRSHLYDYNDKHYLIMSPYSAASFRITLKVPNIKHECDILGDVKIGVRGIKGLNKISLSSRVLVPRVICPKELFNTDMKCNIIKLAIKQGKKAESKFPLKNLSNVPVSLDLSFFTPKNVEEDPQFQCLLHPSVVNIPPGGMAFVNITLKSLKTLGRMPVDQENKSFKKVLVGTARNSALIYTYLLWIDLC